MAEEKTNNENAEYPRIDIEKERDADAEDAKKALGVLMNYGIKQTKRGVKFASKYGKTGLAFAQKQGKEALNKIKQFKQKSVAEKTASAKPAKPEEYDDLFSSLNKHEKKSEDVKNDSDKGIDIDDFFNMLFKAEDKPKLATDVKDDIVKPANEEEALCFNFAVDKENPLDGRIYLKLLLADTDCPTLEVSRNLNELNDFRVIRLKSDRDHYLTKIGNELYRPEDAKTNSTLADLFNALKIDDNFRNKKNDVLMLIMNSALYEIKAKY